VLLTTWAAFASSAAAQNLLPNPGFEEGTDQPAAWRHPGGKGQWNNSARQGKRAIAVTGTGEDQGYWRSENLTLKPGGLYRLSFYARQDAGASGGCAVAGPSRVNRDFRFAESWQRYSFVFTVPVDGTNDFIRLGQWQVKGTLFFDDVELFPVVVHHSDYYPAGGPVFELGEGESIEGGVYRFRPRFGGTAVNSHRPLFLNRAGFNSDRWIFTPGAELIYRFALPGQTQTNGAVRVFINHYVAGVLKVEASRDGTAWLPVRSFDGQSLGGAEVLPSSLFPAGEIFVRLSVAGPEADLQVNRIEFEAGLALPPDHLMEGETQFLDVLESDPRLTLGRFRVGSRLGRGSIYCGLDVTNLSSQDLKVNLALSVDSLAPGPRARRHGMVPAGGRWSCQSLGSSFPGGEGEFSPSVAVKEPGSYTLQVHITDDVGATLFRARTENRVSHLYDPRPGYLLTRVDKCQIWWCESGWKIGRNDFTSALGDLRPKAPLAVSAARGEYESAQLLLAPTVEGELQAVSSGPFRNRRGQVAPIQLRCHEIAYVQVTQPTDDSCEADWDPDPLPPLQFPLKLWGRICQPLWLTFFVPRDTKAGDYTSELKLKLDSETVRVPLAVHVYDFELPRETHLRSALGLGAHEINRYHRLTRPEDRQAVFENYLQNFAEHRISPYSFYDYAPIDVRFVGEGTNKQARVDFTKFDQAAAKWLDEYRFNTFQLPLQGMGGGTFHSRHLGELAGFKEGTPEHARLFQDYLSQVQRHLRERGWLNQAFTYWFDEPDPKDYEFVVEGMKRLKAAAPGIKRMLTEQPEPALRGHVEIWCGLTPEWTPEKVKACRDAGEDVWWYICTGPKAPYVTEFIDHPGTELRLWPWQSWQYGVSGLLVWATIYWTSPLAYPEPNVQDPWADPMSWVSGYGNPVGFRSPWGNGDGRFLYPPQRDPNESTEPCLDGPINSIRWEYLRDGMEDYEYFWLLKQAVERTEASKAPRKLVQQARALLTVPPQVSKDLTHFTTDPRPMLEHRDKLAKMIERLQREK
jgi:hypothetical protein